MRFIVTFCTAIYIVYNENEKYHDRPLKGLLQTAQVIVFFIGGILIISVLFDKSPASLLAGLGASAAILILVFKDSIMGFISGIQLSANNMLRPGDWITMPKYNADGIVLEVTLNTVKVRNWDNTITTLPPYALVSDSFQNWRGMHESGGRRVKRSINIDMNSVRFCTLEVLEKFRKISLIKEYIEETEEELKAYNQERGVDDSVLVNGRRQTNLGVFRAYLERYLRNLSSVNQDMTLMVRHLQPTEKGIPLELYFFTYSKESAVYEQIQADVMDHVLAVVSEFDLAVFQSPTGADFRSIKN
jgi:Small-conductance mechanosensitive channel